MNMKRMAIALVLGALFGLFCVYGTTMVDVPGVEVTMLLLATIFYNRLLIGFVIGLSEDIMLVGGELLNSAVRGGILGVIIGLAITIPGGWDSAILLVFSLVYGVITDVVATRFGK